MKSVTVKYTCDFCEKCIEERSAEYVEFMNIPEQIPSCNSVRRISSSAYGSQVYHLCYECHGPLMESLMAKFRELRDAKE